MRWSVGIEAEGDRVLAHEEIVELADAVAASSGIATGIGTNRYGAQLIVQAGESSSGKLLVFDALKPEWRSIKTRKDPECRVCGNRGQSPIR